MNRFCSNDILRISKTKAKNLYDKIDVYVLPHKLNPDNMWMPPTMIPKNEDFYSFLNSYTYYNCNGETGRYCAFYVDTVR